MIEIIPGKIESAFLYFHSAGTDSREFKPFLNEIAAKMPDTYICIGDGHISGSPVMSGSTFYGDSAEKYWFMFPMQDACSQQSFLDNKEAMGASLLSAGSFVNNLVDQIKEKYDLSADRIILSGFQHGSSLVLASAMMRKHDPFKQVILFEPYLLEAYYLDRDSINPDTTVICVDNHHIRSRTYNWIGVYTDAEFSKMGMKVKAITVEDGNDNLNQEMVNRALLETGRFA